METIKTALLYDPYLDTLGGGERYTLTLAEVLSSQGWQVDLAWNDQKTLSQARDRFGLELNRVNISAEYFTLFSRRQNLLTRLQALKNLGLVFVVSDGSVPILFGKKTILHYQVPFTASNRSPFTNRLKLLSVNHVVVNSQFTKSVVDQILGSNKSTVLYPPVDTTSIQPGKKEKLILNVSRFASPSHSKRQDILITAFKQLVDAGLHDWQLVLAGGLIGDDTLFKELQRQAHGYPVRFLTNPDFNRLKKLYGSASIFWHAAGFEVDEGLNPEAVEHFGIATVEAMAAGCVPVVVNKGGQKEIITPDTGFLVDDLNDLVKKSQLLIRSPQKLAAISAAVVIRARHFSVERFADQVLSLVQ